MRQTAATGASRATCGPALLRFAIIVTSTAVAWMRDNETKRRIERAQETQAAVARVRDDPSPGNIAALHRVHASHLREDGDPAGAARAEARALRAEKIHPGSAR